MPLLLYCVAPQTTVDTDLKGVGGAAVRSRVENGLKFYHSDAADATSARDVVAAAQAVHQVVSAIFAETPVLPFRYPTIVSGEAEIAKLATERGNAYRKFLERVGSKVQMDIRLTLTSEEASTEENAHPQAKPAGRVGHTASGTDYLKARARRQARFSAAVETFRLAADSNEFRVREKDENSRCQVLIERVEVVSFLERMRKLELPGGVEAAISGPWPPAGFWEDEPR